MFRVSAAGRASGSHSLRLGLFGLLPPLLNLVLMNAAQMEQLFLVVDHLLPARAGQGIILHQKNRLLRADFLAKAAEDAPEHVDLKFLRPLLHVAGLRRAARAGRSDANGLRRADEFAQLARHALGPPFLV